MSGPAVTIVPSGGLPVRESTKGGSPFTVVESGGMPVTLADYGPPVRLNRGLLIATAALRAVTGTYTGDGQTKDIALGFVPDVVFVWCDEQQLIWRNNFSWHGRSQRFHTTPSAYNIRSSVEDHPWTPFRKAKFGVDATYSVAARTYKYLALKTNQTDTMEELTIIGNALTGRQVDWTSRRSKLIMTKRDSARSMLFTEDGKAPIHSDILDLTPGNEVVVTDTGMTLSDSVWVNENNNAGRGEAIEYFSFIEQHGFKVVRHVGTGGATTVSGLGDAVFILDASHVAKGQAVIAGGNGSCFDAVAPTAPVSLAGGVLTLPEAYNVAATEYLIVSFADTASPDVEVSAEPTAALVGQADGAITLSPGLALSGDCSWEYYGRLIGYPGENFFHPMLMLGDGADNATSGMNGGMYLFQTDPDTNGWLGPVLRIIHSNYLARHRVTPHNTINYYNLNTGIVIPLREAVHIVVTHNGMGHWRVFLNGHLVKDVKTNLAQSAYGNRLNGGEGTSLPVYANGTTSTGSTNELYRVQIWNSQITDVQAAGLFENAKSGAATNVAGAVLEADFRDQLPAGITGVTQGAPGARLDPPYFLQGGSDSSRGTPSISNDAVRVTTTGGSNGRAYTRVGTGTFEIRTVIRYDNATRIIGRMSTDVIGVTGGVDFFDVTGTGTLDRTDTVSAVDANMFYIGITSTNQYFTIMPETTITRVS